MAHFGLTKLERLAHGLVMMTFGAAVFIVVAPFPIMNEFVTPPGLVVPVKHPVLPLFTFATVVAALGDILWDRPVLHEHPFYAGILFSLLGLLAFFVAFPLMSGVKAEDLVDALTAGLSLGFLGFFLTLPLGPLLGWMGVCLSGWIQGVFYPGEAPA